MKLSKEKKTKARPLPPRPAPFEGAEDEAGSKEYAEATLKLFEAEFPGQWRLKRTVAGWWHCEEV